MRLLEEKGQVTDVEYTLHLNSEQAVTLLKAVELLMRLKINQPEEISRAVLDGMYERIGIDVYCRRRDTANACLKRAFDTIFPTIDDIKKDEEWYRLYNLYQSVRYARHEAEYPNGTGVDSYPPMQMTDEPIPKCEWKKGEEK